MKKMNFIAFVMLTLCFHFSYSQKIETTSPEAKLEFRKRTIDNSAFIFEGTTTQQQKCYRSKYGLLTCTTISITKIYKGSGQIKLGSIKLITAQGGSIEDNNGNTEIETITDGGPVIRKGQTYIIFGSLADSSYLGYANSPVRIDTTDNKLILSLNDVIYFDFKNQKLHPNQPYIFPVAKWGSVGSNFKT